MRYLLAVALVSACVVSALPSLAAQAPAPMTNADVVKMVKAGLGDDVVVAAIRGAQARSFAVTADDLVQLKSDGVSDRVIATMLQPNAAGPAAAPPSGTAPAAPPPTPSIGGAPVSAAYPVAQISLASAEGPKALAPEGGDISQTFAFVRTIVWANFRGLTSDVRTTERRPAILIRTDESKFDTRFMMVKTEADDDDNVRSVRLKSGVYSVSTAFAPDSDWIIETDAEQVEPGLWRLTPEKDLGRGEYGVVDTQNRYLYGFGVDR